MTFGTVIKGNCGIIGIGISNAGVTVGCCGGFIMFLSIGVCTIVQLLFETVTIGSIVEFGG